MEEEGGGSGGGLHVNFFANFCEFTIKVSHP
jgi:hypothetical protein